GKPVLCEPRDRRIFSRSYYRHSCRDAVLILAPQLTERLAEDPCECGRREIWDAASRRVGERRQRLRTESIGEVLVKAGAIGVDGGAAGPIGQPAVDPIERLETVMPRGFVDDGAKVTGMETPFAGDHALLVGG